MGTFSFFRAVGSGRFECLSVSALIALARRGDGEHIILRDTYIYGIIYIFFCLAHAHVCAYMYACTYVCVYVYIYVRPWLAFIFSVLSPRRRCPGVEDFSWFPDG